MKSRQKMVLAKRRAQRRLNHLLMIGVFIVFSSATFLSGRLGVEMARNRLNINKKATIAPAEMDDLTLALTDDPLYLAQSPESLRRFFSSYPTAEERARADLTGLGIRRLQDSIDLITLRAEADAVEVQVNSGAIAGAVYWIHHSQLPAPSAFDPIVSPVPVAPVVPTVPPAN